MINYSLDKDPIALLLGILFVVFAFFGLNTLREQEECISGKTYIQNNNSITFNENGTYAAYYTVSTDTIKYFGNWRVFNKKLLISIGGASNGKGIFKVNVYENTCDKLYNDEISFTLSSK